jgi:hypothetical protein
MSEQNLVLAPTHSITGCGYDQHARSIVLILFDAIYNEKLAGNCLQFHRY